MANTGTARSTKIKDLLARGNEDVLHTTKNTSSELGAEGVPYTVLDLGTLLLTVNRDALLAVDRLAGRNVLRNEKGLLALSNKNAGVLVRLENNVRAALRTTLAAPCTSSSPTPARCSTASTAATAITKALQYR